MLMLPVLYTVLKLMILLYTMKGDVTYVMLRYDLPCKIILYDIYSYYTTLT